METFDGAFDSDSEDVYLDLDISDWKKGNYEAMIWAYSKGMPQNQPYNWVSYLTIEITPGE
ncbi:MAG: hypothetical protein ACP5QG_00425 [candidate division WOR-3 bacterium]